VFASAATNYIATHAASTHAPFFIYLAFNGVHDPLEAKLQDLTNANVLAITNLNRRTNAAMTLAVDRAVGTVMNQLTNSGLITNTLVVFLNDNGGPEDNLQLNAPNWSDT
jgi:membrane-anchored protein YejM (alkaline phosphatase superfamily)